MRLRIRLAGLAVAAFAAAVWAPAASSQTPLAASSQTPPGARDVQVQVDSPGPGRKVTGHVHQAEIAGLALAHGDDPEVFDVMLAIDVSYSTRVASGADVDGDGVVGIDPARELLKPGTFPQDLRSTDAGDTVLHAQARAALALLEGLDPRRVRVGILSFSGDVDPITGKRKRIDQQDARLEAPLTHDYDSLRRVVAGVVARGPQGATNFAAGVRLGIVELAGLGGAKSAPRPGAKKVILFLTDGVPTLPVGKGADEDAGDQEAALRAAKLAHGAGIVINTYALGVNALRYPKVATEMARITAGTYTPVQNPADIVTLLGGVTFADVEDVVFTNLSTGDFSTDVRLAPDGSFTGFVPVKEGTNRVRISALATDGSRGSIEFEFEFAKSQVGERTDLAELERIRRQNKDLELRRMQLEIDAFRAEQLKRVEIEAARPEAGAETPSAP